MLSCIKNGISLSWLLSFVSGLSGILLKNSLILKDPYTVSERLFIFSIQDPVWNTKYNRP